MKKELLPVYDVVVATGATLINGPLEGIWLPQRDTAATSSLISDRSS
jgi:uncharacterized protein (DUF4213/DUF364 family)